MDWEKIMISFKLQALTHNLQYIPPGILKGELLLSAFKKVSQAPKES